MDVLGQVTDDLYAGGKLIYDDKAKAIEMLRYGLFLKTKDQFRMGLEYNRMGDKTLLETTINHQVNKDT